MGAVICDVSFQPRCKYERNLRPRLLDLLLSCLMCSHVALDVHLRAFAVDAGVPDLPYDQLHAVYEEVAVLLGHDKGDLEHAVWRHRSKGA
ncbi:hypothetical protein AQI95_39830 [Streptomyces yokosukanensis]|uniref:Uncharacterized protein n=1 Tax=Streptomyces yokosukanensis TaxID=67386 RepID=A0A101NU28_9ACTN|nr:hypothetical protein AQI95_39830 [Streptomyces yokosukanensis]